MKYWALAEITSSAIQNGFIQRGQANRLVINRMAPRINGMTRRASTARLPW